MLKLHSIRLYSTKKFKALGTLEYHKSGCFALAFARPLAPEEAQEDEDYELEELIARGQWLVSGGKDSRVCIWPLISFSKKEGQ
jgi:ASTRA-associated protein 1